jgi:integrase
MASGQETLLAYFRANNEKFDKRVGVNRSKGSAKVYWNALNHVTRFVSEKYHLSDIPFSALDRSFINKYDLYLRTERKLSQGMIVLLTIRLGTIINHAIAEGIITANPFAGYKRVHPTPKQKYLTREELDSLMATPLKSQKQYLIRDLFLFSAYTGISYCDMCALTEENVSTAEDGTVWIKAARKKTGNRFEIPLLDIPLQILERYRGTATDGKLLPMYSNSAMNLALKEIAEMCGIFRRFSFHVARHTYASEITLSQGIPIETVSRMLGHSEIKTTQIYAKITDDKIDEDIYLHNPRSAARIHSALLDDIELLADQPLLGYVEHVLEDLPCGYRSLVIGKKYKALYRIENENVIIVTIHDCRRNPARLRKSVM